MQCLHGRPSSPATAFYYIFLGTSPALHTWPNANRAKSLINLWCPRSKGDHYILTGEVPLVIRCIYKSTEEWEEHRWGNQDASGVQRPQSVRGFLVEAVLSCSPVPYTEDSVQLQAIVVAVSLVCQAVTLRSSLPHHEAFSGQQTHTCHVSAPLTSPRWKGKQKGCASCRKQGRDQQLSSSP